MRNFLTFHKFVEGNYALALLVVRAAAESAAARQLEISPARANFSRVSGVKAVADFHDWAVRP